MRVFMVIRVFFVAAMITTMFFIRGAFAQGTTTFSDGDFDPASWFAEKIFDSTVGQGATFLVDQAGTGGNPDTYRSVIQNWSGDGMGSKGLVVGHLLNDGLYDPELLGGIIGLDVSFDAIFSPLTSPWAVACGPLVYQNGHYYRVYGQVTSDTWTHFDFLDLASEDFDIIGGGSPLHPDFSH